MNYKFKYIKLSRIRIQDIDTELIPNIASKSQWKKMVKKRLVLCDSKVATLSTWVNPNSLIEILWSKQIINSSKVFPLELEVVYEDDFIAVVNKPAGIPTSGNVFKSLQNALEFNLSRSKEMDLGDSFQTCHRLDYSTSGLVLISKTKKSRSILGIQFEKQKIQKYYYAIVQGKLNLDKGKWDSFIENKKAESEYKVVKCVQSLKNDFLSLVKLSPKTGRTHQLRIHSFANGHPIVGDTKYYTDSKNIFKGKGLFLCAYKIEFQHPITTKDISIKIETPNKFSKLLDNEERRFKKYNPK